MKVPPGESDCGAGEVGQNVERIGGGTGIEARADPFEEKRPEAERKKNLAEGGWLVVVAQLEAALQEEKGRECAGNEQQIVELAPEESRGDVRFESPTIEDVKGAGNQEERIAEITKHFKAGRG